jgi:ubiquitin C-terminal hydrolase
VYVSNDKNSTLGGVGGAVASSPTAAATVRAGAALSVAQTVSQAAEESLPSGVVTTPPQSRGKPSMSYALAASRASPPSAPLVGVSPPLLRAGLPLRSAHTFVSPVATRPTQSAAVGARPSAPSSALVGGSASHRGVAAPPPLLSAAPLVAVLNQPPPIITRWQQSALRPYRALVGLHNLGSSCFLNAVLQAVCTLPPMAALFASGAFKRYLSPRSPHGGRVARAFADLCVALCQGKSGTVANAAPLKRELAKAVGALFGDNEQHDAHECTRTVVDVLNDETNPALPRPFVRIQHEDGDSAPVRASRCWAGYTDREQSPLRDLFAGQTQTTTSCACGHVSHAFEIVWDVSLSFPRNETTGALVQQVSLEALIQNHMKAEKLSSSNGFVCPGCKQTAGVARMTRETRLSRLPDVFVIHFNRFEQIVRVERGEEGGAAARGKRINTHVIIPRELSMRCFATEGALHPDDTDFYEKHSSIRHTGGTSGGHYVASVETQAGVEHVFDDKNVLDSKAAWRDGVDTYMLVYHRRVAPPPPPPAQPKGAHPVPAMQSPIEPPPPLGEPPSNDLRADARIEVGLRAPELGALSAAASGLPAVPEQVLPLAKQESVPSESAASLPLPSPVAPSAFEPESSASAPALVMSAHANAPLSVSSASAAPFLCAAELPVGAVSAAGINVVQPPSLFENADQGVSLSADDSSAVDVATIVPGPVDGVAGAAPLINVGGAASEQLEKEFGFVLDACNALVSKVAECCQDWACQASGSATAPTSWHSTQFEDALEALTQVLVRLGEFGKSQIPTEWHVLRKRHIDTCTELISSLEMLHNKFVESFAALRRTGEPDDVRVVFALIGERKPPADYAPVCLQQLNDLLLLPCPAQPSSLSHDVAADASVSSPAVGQHELLLDERLVVPAPLPPASGAPQATLDGKCAAGRVPDAGVANVDSAEMAEQTIADNRSAPLEAGGDSAGGGSTSDALNVSGELGSDVGSVEPAAERVGFPSVSPVVPPPHECVIHDLFGSARQTAGAGSNLDALTISLDRVEEHCKNHKVSGAPSHPPSVHMIENRHLGSELRGSHVYLSTHELRCDLSMLSSKAVCLLRCVRTRASACTHCELKIDAKGVRFRIAHADLRHLNDDERFVASMHEGVAFPAALRCVKFLTREGDSDAQNNMRVLVRVEVAAALVVPGTLPTLGALGELEMKLNTWYELGRGQDRVELALVSTPVDVVTMCSWAGQKSSSSTTGELLAAVGLRADLNNGRRVIGGDAESLYSGQRATDRCLSISIAQGLVYRLGVTPDDLRSKSSGELPQLFMQVQAALLSAMGAACLGAPFLAQELEFVISRLHGREEKISGVVVEYSMRPTPGSSIFALFERRGKANPMQLATLPELVKLTALAMASSTLFPKCLAAELVVHWGCATLDDASSLLRRLLGSSKNMRLLRLIVNRGVRTVWSEGVEKRDLDSVLSDRVAQKMKQLPPASDLCDVLATFYAFSLRPLQSGNKMGRFCMRLAAWVLRMSGLPAFAVLSREAGTQQSGPRLSIERAGDGVGCAGAQEHMLIAHYYPEDHFEVVLPDHVGRRSYFLTSEGEGLKHSALERLARDNLERAALLLREFGAHTHERRNQSVNAHPPSGASDAKRVDARSHQRGTSAPSSAQANQSALPLGPRVSSPSATQPPLSSQSSPTLPAAAAVVVPESLSAARSKSVAAHAHSKPGTTQAHLSKPSHADAARLEKRAPPQPTSSVAGAAANAAPAFLGGRMSHQSSAAPNADAALSKPPSRSPPSEAARVDAVESAAAPSPSPAKRKRSRRRRSRKQPSDGAPVPDAAKSVDSPAVGADAVGAAGAAAVAASSSSDSLHRAAASTSAAPASSSPAEPKRTRRRRRRRSRKQAASGAPPSAPARNLNAQQRQQQPHHVGARRRRGGRRSSAPASKHVCARDGCNFPKNGNRSPEWKQYVSSLGKNSSDIHLCVDGLKFLDGWVRYTFHFHDAAVVERVRQQARAAWLEGEETGAILGRMDRKKGEHCLLGPERCRADGGAQCARCLQC